MQVDPFVKAINTDNLKYDRFLRILSPPHSFLMNSSWTSHSINERVMTMKQRNKNTTNNFFSHHIIEIALIFIGIYKPALTRKWTAGFPLTGRGDAEIICHKKKKKDTIATDQQAGGRQIQISESFKNIFPNDWLTALRNPGTTQ